MSPPPNSPAATRQPPPTLGGGRYIVTGLLGKGGTARVYRGWDDRLRTWRAIKVLSPAHVDDPSMRERFMNEARTMARFEHANLIQTVDVIDDPDTPFFVMELAEGGAVIDWLKRNGAMSEHLALSVVRAMCDGLSACHAQNIVHRDVKPHNVLIDRKNRCKLTDFGIAQLDANMSMTQTGSQMGTFAYMAPEQRSDAKSVDHRADLYAAGASLFTMLTCKTSADLFVAEADDDLFAGLSPQVVQLLIKACAYKPELRFQTAEAMLDAIEALLIDTAPPPSGEPPLCDKPMKLPDSPPTALTDVTELDELLTGLARRAGRDAAPAELPEAPKSAPSVIPYQMSRPAVDRARTFAEVSDSSEARAPSYLAEEEIQRERELAKARAIAAAAEAAVAEAIRNAPPPPPERPKLTPDQMLYVAGGVVATGLLFGALLTGAAFTGRSAVNTQASTADAAYGVLIQAVQRDPGLLEDLTRAGASVELREAYFAWQDAPSADQRAAAFDRYLVKLDTEAKALSARGAASPLAQQKVDDILTARTAYQAALVGWKDAAGSLTGWLATTLGLAPKPPR